ncbi:MAG: response regulator [Spirochaetota bacterium]|nr:response regulator [Spirochaetota bacterium]
MTQDVSIMEFNDNKQHSILVVDDSTVIRKMVVHILENHNYNILQAEDGSKAIEILQNEKIDFVVTDINMPQVGGFALVKKLHELKLEIPYIMITDADINKYIELAIELNVGNILSKPIEKSELLNTVYKLLFKKSIFGLQNYLHIEESKVKTINISSSEQCVESVLKIVDSAEEAGLEDDFLSSFRLILSEMAINALYHPHGFTDKKEERLPVQLREGDKIQIQYGNNDIKFGVSITDFEGKLTKLTILKSFKEFIDNNENMIRALEEGKDPTAYLKDKGRGLQLAREMANEYYFNIKTNQITEIIILSWLKKKPVEHASQSIKINEIN